VRQHYGFIVTRTKALLAFNGLIGIKLYFLQIFVRKTVNISGKKNPDYFPKSINTPGLTPLVLGI
jgi:hypothetical protein